MREPPAASSVEPPRGSLRAVLVHVDSPSPVALQIKSDDDSELFRSVCTSPCDAYLPADGEYRIAGGSRSEQQKRGAPSLDLRPSGSFSLPAGLTRDTIAVEPRSENGLIGGVALTIGGVLAIGVAFVWAIATSFSHMQGGGADMTGPVLTAVGGGAALAGGVALTVFNFHTRVSQNGPAKAGAVDSPWLRVGVWREGVPEQQATLRTMGLPLFRIVF